MSELTKILVSACLMGEKVRYDGKDNLINHPSLQRLKQNNQVILACPESLGGLPTPRAPAEIIAGSNPMKILTQSNQDVTKEFKLGAQKTLNICLEHNVKVALMAAKSPSCGNIQTYDGKFKRNLIDQAGVTANLLMENGIKVFNQYQIEQFSKATQLLL